MAGPGQPTFAGLLSRQVRATTRLDRAMPGVRLPRALTLDDLDDYPATDVAVGVSVFLTDFGVPVWSNGTAWVTALGVPPGQTPDLTAAPAAAADDPAMPDTAPPTD